MTDTIEIRPLVSEDAEKLTACFARCYGDSYVAGFFYDPPAFPPEHFFVDVGSIAQPVTAKILKLIDATAYFMVHGDGIPDFPLGALQGFSVALLGADYSIDNGRYRFARVYNGENWNPGLRAPLTQPGVAVRAGEYLLAVNGRDLTDKQNVFEAIEGTANKQVRIKVGANPDGSGSREVIVQPVGSESALRYQAWVEDNRRKVQEMSGGRISYVYMPDTSPPGYASFNRYFTAQLDNDAVLIDERFNGGGYLSDYVIQILTRKVLGMGHQRDHEDFPIPIYSNEGPKAMIINEMAGSGGDALPMFLRTAKVGKLIGNLG